MVSGLYFLSLFFKMETQFIHEKKYLLNIYYVLGILLGKKKIPHLQGIVILVEKKGTKWVKVNN